MECEDAKMAVKAAKQKGIIPFCVSIDHEAYDYLPYIFGSQSYFYIKNAAELPKTVYAVNQLTHGVLPGLF